MRSSVALASVAALVLSTSAALASDPVKTGETVSYSISQNQGEAMRLFAGAGAMMGGPDISRVSVHGLLDVRPLSFLAFRGELMKQVTKFGDVPDDGFTKVEAIGNLFLGFDGDGGFTTGRSSSSISYVEIPGGSFQRYGLDFGLTWDKHKNDLALVGGPVGYTNTNLIIGLRQSRQEYFRANTDRGTFFTNRRFDWYLHYQRVIAQDVESRNGVTILSGKTGFRGGLEWTLGRPVAMYAKLEAALNPSISNTAEKPADFSLVMVLGLTSVLPLGF